MAVFSRSRRVALAVVGGLVVAVLLAAHAAAAPIGSTPPPGPEPSAPASPPGNQPSPPGHDRAPTPSPSAPPSASPPAPPPAAATPHVTDPQCIGNAQSADCQPSSSETPGFFDFFGRFAHWVAEGATGMFTRVVGVATGDSLSPYLNTPVFNAYYYGGTQDVNPCAQQLDDLNRARASSGSIASTVVPMIQAAYDKCVKDHPQLGSIPIVGAAQLAAGLAVLILVVAIIAGVLAGAPWQVVKPVLVRLPIAVLVMFGGLYIVGLLLALTDGMAHPYLANLQVDGQELVHRISGDGTLQSAELFFVSLFLALFSLAVLAEQVLRLGLIYVVLVLVPLVAAVSIHPKATSALRRVIEGLLALIFSKLVMVLVLAAGVAMIIHGPVQQGLIAPVVGLVMVLLAALSPFALMSLFHSAGGAGGVALIGGLAGGGAGAGAGAAMRGVDSSLAAARRVGRTGGRVAGKAAVAGFRALATPPKAAQPVGEAAAEPQGTASSTTNGSTPAVPPARSTPRLPASGEPPRLPPSGQSPRLPSSWERPPPPGSEGGNG